MELNFDEYLQFEEENEIIEQFMTIMNSEGFGDSYSFDENIASDFLIYKNNYKWALEYNNDGHWETKEYTNIYDLCLSVLRYLDINTDGFENDHWLKIPRGTKVVATESSFFEDMVTGVIIDSYHSGSQDETFYEILTDDDRYIICSRDCKDNVNGYFVTIETFINHLNLIIKINEEDRINIDETKKLKDILNKIIACKEEYLDKSDCKIKNKELK